MNPFSRRSVLRLGGAAGCATVVAAHATPSHADEVITDAVTADPVNTVTAWVDAPVVAAGAILVLQVRDSLQRDRSVAVQDASGLEWVLVYGEAHHQVWVALARTPGVGRVTVLTTSAFRSVIRNDVAYEVTSGSLGTGGMVGPLIGMSAPADLWDRRVAEVGGGLAARRIFADLGEGATSQLDLVAQAHEAGMLPVISYKVGGDVRGAASGALDGVAEQAAERLADFGLMTAVTVWHEPYGDMTGAEYVAMNRRLLPLFRRDELRVGPILNGWLLDNQVETFASFCPDEALDLWDWFGIDTYESGTADDPGTRAPAERVVALSGYLGSRGIDLPIGVGEYNGYTAESIEQAGEALLSTPNVWFGCMWNSTEGKGLHLEGDRLAAFRATLADTRLAESTTP